MEVLRLIDNSRVFNVRLQPFRSVALLAGSLVLAAAGCFSETDDASSIASDFGLAFSPIFSAYDGVHEYRVPVIALNVPQPDRWEIVDASGNPAPDAATITEGMLPGGVEGAMLTTGRAGSFVLLAHLGDETGCAELHISKGDPDLWIFGKERYADARRVAGLTRATATGDAHVPEDAACKSCHGAERDAPIREFTPQQFGGRSDEELVSILTNGELSQAPKLRSRCETLPRLDPGGYSHTDLSAFHRWSMTSDERAGLILYLRSIAPVSLSELDGR